MPKQMLPEDWFLGLLRVLKVGEEIDLLEGATEGPRGKLLVKRTSSDRLGVNRKPPAKATTEKKRVKTPTRIVVANKKGQVLYDSSPRPRALITGSGKRRQRKPDPVLAEAGKWFKKLNHPESGVRRIVEAYARND